MHASYWTEYTMYHGSERELRFPLTVYSPRLMHWSVWSSFNTLRLYKRDRC